ncbi:MAG: LexA family protein [Balneolaceae bacterium]
MHAAKQKTSATPSGHLRSETGFPSPATDHLEPELDLHQHVVKHPSATFFIRVSSDRYRLLGIEQRDLLVVDRSLAPKKGSLVVCILDGAREVCKIERAGNGWVLLRGDGARIQYCADMVQEPIEIWGVVSHTIRQMP